MASNKEKNKRIAKSSVTASVQGDPIESPDSREIAEQLEFYFQAAIFETNDDPIHRRKRPEERGLPSDTALEELAKAYLETQRKLWPEKVISGQLPALNDVTISRMAADFKRRFLAGDSELDLPVLGKDCAASYNRFSDEGSNHRSLAQQLRLQLERAAQNKHFIPWEYVFADAAVTGTTARRRGYEMVKAALSADHLAIRILYIDEIGRASRDAIEALSLGKMLDALERTVMRRWGLTSIAIRLFLLSTLSVSLITSVVAQEDTSISEKIERLTRAIAENPKNTMAYVERGALYGVAGKDDLQLADLNKAFEIGNFPSPAHRAVTHQVRVGAWLAKKEYDKALADCNEALRLQPDLKGIQKQRGRLYYRRGEYEKAKSDFEKAITDEPQDSLARIEYARLLACCPEADLRDGRKAVEQAKRACELTDWKDPVALVTLGCAYAESGEFEKALSMTTKVEASDPQMAKPFKELFLKRMPHRDIQAKKPDK